MQEGSRKSRRANIMYAAALGALACFSAREAHAITWDVSPDFVVNFDNSITYNLGMRAQKQDSNIANNLTQSEGDYKFSKQSDIVTNRFQDLIELQGVYQGNTGFRTSGSIWKDFAYNDKVEQNPNYSGISSYAGGRYSNYTKNYFQQGGEALDYFVFANREVADIPVYLKFGRLTEYWGNSFFFGFSNIAYSQSPIDFIKGFTQPGSEVKELFLPRRQIYLAADLTPKLSVAAEYFFEFEPNRYPESATYLGFSDLLFAGPNTTDVLGGHGLTHFDGNVHVPNNNGNFGLKATWSPDFLNGDLGFYYRQFDEVHPWPLLINPATGAVQNRFAEGSRLIGVSLEKTYGLISTGFEVSHRFRTALNSAALTPTNEGARGDITNVIANTLIQLGGSPLWDTGTVLGELSYTHLDGVTTNQSLYNGAGHAACVGAGGGAGSWKDGCSTNHALALAVKFDPQWLQVLPSIDIDMPISLTTGLIGTPAYAAGTFYAQDSKIYSIGITATYKQKSTLSLQYNGYYWRPGPKGDNGLGRGLAAYMDCAGACALNDRGWISLTAKTSF